MARMYHVATLLNDGLSVLVTGGLDVLRRVLSTAELYTRDSWFYTKSNMTAVRRYHAAVLLLDGKVLVAGGSDTLANTLSSVEVYNPITRMFSPTQSMTCARSRFTLTLLPSGQVLAAGGMGSTVDQCLLITELYDPSTGQWTSTRLLNTARYDHAAILINNSALVIGGKSNTSHLLYECERYDL